MPKMSDFSLKIRRKGDKKRRKNNNFSPNSHASGEILDTDSPVALERTGDPLPSLNLVKISKKHPGVAFCFVGNFMEKADDLCNFSPLWGNYDGAIVRSPRYEGKAVAPILRVLERKLSYLIKLVNKFTDSLDSGYKKWINFRSCQDCPNEQIHLFRLATRFTRAGQSPLTLSADGRIKLNFNGRSLANILLLAILILEMAMPHKIFAMDFNAVVDEKIAKYQFAELALASDVYAFNDKYVPEEIELQKLAAERKPPGSYRERLWRDGSFKVASTKTVTTTAYSSTVDQCDDTPFIAASGRRVHDGMVAANFLPFNTKIRIPEIFGDKIFIVEDRMNRRFQDRVDIWMETREEALQYGVRNVIIEVLED